MPEAGTPRPADKPRASLFDLLLRLVDDAVLVVRSEFRMAWGEIRSSLAEAAANLALVVVGAMLIGVALMFLLAGLLIWLSFYVGVVAAALIAAAIAIILGGLTLYAGLQRLQSSELAQRRKAANLGSNTTAPAPAKGD